MELIFETDYESIIKKLDQIEPVKYGYTRNYINGDVTYLSPYISRGVISTKQVLDYLLAKGFKLKDIESFVKELCWRDYFQRVAQEKNINQEIKHTQTPVSNYGIPARVLKASTDIAGIDFAIDRLYKTGYMHNHCRMYTASIVCNIAKSHWLNPAQWMYYHLLDGDWASNACSWQWVAGANSNKKYFANQENINKYIGTSEKYTFLDKTYEALEVMEIPAELFQIEKFIPELQMPKTSEIEINNKLPTFIYNYYNLDPLWHKQETGNRILLIEPDIFSQYPISQKCFDFMIALSKNIQDIQIYVGSFNSLKITHQLDNIFYKEHPFNFTYQGVREERDWIAKEVSGYYPSFFSYWKKVEKQLLNKQISLNFDI